MRQIRSRFFYCEKIGRIVVLMEYMRCADGCESVCGVLSCSDQEICAAPDPETGEPVYGWGTCPACTEPGARKK